MRTLKRALVPFAAALIGAAAGGVALGSIPGSNGVISGCYSKLTGALRVIDASKQTCPTYQTPISWSQTGPQGPPGPSVVASGQSNDAQGSTECTYDIGLTYCNPTNSSTSNGLGPSTAMTFTPSTNAECLVNLDGQITSQNGGAGVQYGIGENTSSGDQSVDGTNITTTLGDFPAGGTDNAASFSRSRLIPVQAGTTYTFELWIRSDPGYPGEAYFDMDYVCFAT